VDPGNATTTMYIATLSDTDQEVIVKFTAHYNLEAHRLLAKVGFVLTLRFCECVIGDLYMVVMDCVDGKSIWQLQEDKIPVPEIVARSVTDAIELLHENDTVFGDLWDQNILYDASKACVVLVDFGWSRKDGESRYPATLNPSNTWVEDVSPYSIMHKAHDLWQLEQLIALCNFDA